MPSDYNVPNNNDEKPESPRLPDLSRIIPNQRQQKEIIIGEFGLEKLALSQYLKGVNVIKSKLGEKTNDANYNGKLPAQIQQDAPITTSLLGTPVWDYLAIESGSYIDNQTGKTVNYNEQTFHSVLINSSQSHRLVLTDIQGRDNEVIEYVGKASIRLNIKCGIFSNNNNRPRNEIINVINILNSNQPIKIKFCNFLADLNISQFYVLDKNINQTMGGYNYQLFEFNAINNVPVILATIKTQNAASV